MFIYLLSVYESYMEAHDGHFLLQIDYLKFHLGKVYFELLQQIIYLNLKLGPLDGPLL